MNWDQVAGNWKQFTGTRDAHRRFQQAIAAKPKPGSGVLIDQGPPNQIALDFLGHVIGGILFDLLYRITSVLVLVQLENTSLMPWLNEALDKLVLLCKSNA